MYLFIVGKIQRMGIFFLRIVRAILSEFWVLPRLLNLILIIISFGYLAYRFKTLSPQIPLWYTRSWGSGQLAESIYLWLIPICLLGVFGLNLVMTIFIFKKGSFLTKLINWEGVFIALLALAAEWRIIILTIP